MNPNNKSNPRKDLKITMAVCEDCGQEVVLCPEQECDDCSQVFCKTCIKSSKWFKYECIDCGRASCSRCHDDLFYKSNRIRCIDCSDSHKEGAMEEARCKKAKMRDEMKDKAKRDVEDPFDGSFDLPTQEVEAC